LKSKKILLVNDESDTLNFGNRAHSKALIHMVEKYGGEIHHVISHRDVSSLRYKVYKEKTDKIINNIYMFLPKYKILYIFIRKIISLLFYKLKLNSIVFNNLPGSWRGFNRFANKVAQGSYLKQLRKFILNSDVVIINGNGSFSDTSSEKVIALLFIAYLTKIKYNKYTAIVNHTCDISDPILQEMISNVYPLLDNIIFREKQSLAVWNFKNASFAPDTAFIYKPQIFYNFKGSNKQNYDIGFFEDLSNNFDEFIPYICVGGSSIYKWYPNYNISEIFLRLCKILKDTFPQLILVPSSSDDLTFLYPISSKLSLPILNPKSDIQHYFNIIGNSRLIITGRWHQGVCAITGGVPLIGLSSVTFKMKALLELIDWDEKFFFDAFSLQRNMHKILNSVEHFYYNYEKYNKYLMNKDELFKDLTWNNIGYLL